MTQPLTTDDLFRIIQEQKELIDRLRAGSDPISLPINEFCRRAGIGQTLAREMISDGRLRATRVGKKKLLVDVESWREHLRRHAVEGVPEYNATKKAVEARKAKRKAREVERELPPLRDVLQELGSLRR